MKHSILGLSLALFFSSTAAFAALVKPAQLQGTEYCQDQEKLKQLGTINHLDERNGIDRIVIQKKTRQMHLLSQGRIYKTYNVNFGFGSLQGNKIVRGDGRTPEGLYHVEGKNPQSKFTLALRVSYPNNYDKAWARANGITALGGDIMIHGYQSDRTKKENLIKRLTENPKFDWTEGCVAVSDKEIREIYPLISVGTAIEICPSR